MNLGESLDLKLFGSGIYHLVQDSEVVYVGASINLAQRISAWVGVDCVHYDEVRVFPVCRDEAASLEQEHIERLRPRYNYAGINIPYKSPEGNWRSTERFCITPHNSHPDQSVRFFTRTSYVQSLTGSLSITAIRKLKLVPVPCPRDDALLILESIGFPCPDYCQGAYPRWFKQPVLDWLETQSFDDEASPG